jgi:Coenzyme PQQ synthesis protein D (PqqD)
MRLRTDDVVQQETDGETVLLDLRSSTYFVVNETGTCLLPLLLEGVERQALLDALLETFDVGEQQAGEDLDRFVEDLRRQDLIVEQ